MKILKCDDRQIETCAYPISRLVFFPQNIRRLQMHNYLALWKKKGVLCFWIFHTKHESPAPYIFSVSSKNDSITLQAKHYLHVSLSWNVIFKVLDGTYKERNVVG